MAEPAASSLRHATHEVARAALAFLWTQPNAAVMCPVSTTYSAIPALRRDPELAADSEPA
ncbi:MAG: hypothetical protein H0V26_06680 [Solirubrobacterales bacterium]|nr:hypothetical protein [Solirubrobacterales bacterium]